MASLAVEYRPKKFSDVVEQDAVVKMLEGICKADELKNRNFLLIGPAGTGKAQPMWSKVLTVDGFLPMRQIQIGMKVYTHNGNIAKITGIYPQGERDIYTIYTKSGEYIDVADNHLNVIVQYKNNEMVEQVVDTLTLLNIYNRDLHNIYLPVYNITDHTIKQYTQITKIMYSGCYHCQCIMLDHEDHTYMTDGYIVTHNTTLGRIVSNELNDGKGEPIEIDAASHSGVDNVREIISQARTYPIGCKYKVFILDECHSFSNTAWQSFLKVLEEGPAKTVFVFCTTNPEKIPATIISRVQTFQLSKISLDGIYSRLKYVLDSEISNGRDIKYDEDTLKFIAKLANGGMRDSLTLLDTALTYSNVINSENVSKALNLPDYDSYFELLSAYAKHDNVGITKIVDAVYNSGVNFTKWFERFHSFIVNIMKYIYLKDINLTMIPSHYIDKIQKYNTNHAIICLHLANVLVKLNHELKSTQYLQELALTYLCTTPKKG